MFNTTLQTMMIKGEIIMFVLISFALYGERTNAQSLSQTHLDSLGYEELLTEFNLREGDSVNQELIARTYLERARAEKDTIKMARGYDRLALIFDTNTNLKYADSIIYIARNSNHKTYPTLGYIIKGSIYHNNKDFKRATDYFIQADHWATKNQNDYLKLFIKKVLVGIKSIWGIPSEALKYSKEYLSLLESVDYNSMYKDYLRSGLSFDADEADLFYKIDYVEALDLITIAYIFDEQFHQAKANNKKTLTLVDEFKLEDKYHFYLTRSGEIEFYLGNYKASIDSLKKALPFKLSSSSWLNSYFYLGHSYINLGSKEKGIKYLVKADSIFELTEEILPSHAQLFHTLYHYSKDNGNLEDQLNYLNKITKIDSLFKENYRYINSKITKDYDIPLLIKEKEYLISRLTDKNKINRNINILVISLLILSLACLIYFIRRKTIFQMRFNELISKQIIKEPSGKGYSYEVSDQVLQSIYLKLENFENNQGFLNSEISLYKLAKDFETNPNYLSQAINLRIGKNFSQYINDLRIDFAVNHLLNDSRMRRYTIKAIADECGYKNAESFSKAFYKRNGIYPSYYIKQLDKKIGLISE